MTECMGFGVCATVCACVRACVCCMWGYDSKSVVSICLKQNKNTADNGRYVLCNNDTDAAGNDDSAATRRDAHRIHAGALGGQPQ